MEKIQQMADRLAASRVKLFVLMAGLGLVLSAIVGTTHTWFNEFGYILSPGNSAGIGLGRAATMSQLQLQQVLYFALDGTVRGVPGEAVPVTEYNVIKPEKMAGEYIFCVTYRIPGEDIQAIEDLFLDRELVEERKLLSIRSNQEDGGLAVTYYGVGADNEAVDLGELYVAFAPAEVAPMGEGIHVSAQAQLCQRHENAFQDIFLVPDEDMDFYSSLFDGE